VTLAYVHSYPRVALVSRYDWLLFLHVTGAFLLLGGIVMVAVFTVAAWRRERPSEIALRLGMTRFGLPAISIGMLVTLGFGLWLVHDVGYVDWTDGWVIASLVLWVVTGFLGDRGGRFERETRTLAERLAAAGDAPSPELSARLRNPLALALNWGSALTALAILVLMIWKPGA
jgi:uncharacterized membrane protein